MDPFSVFWLIVVGVIVIDGTIFHLAGWELDRDIDKPKQIPTEIQAEIDQTSEWWDREFRKLAGQPEPNTGACVATWEPHRDEFIAPREMWTSSKESRYALWAETMDKAISELAADSKSVPVDDKIPVKRL